ncbi:hypothetical protein BJX99DRAFT_235195 [Aspergillus californicus]
MSTGPPLWLAQDKPEPQPPVETRPRRSRRKKDDDIEIDRKETTKPAKSKLKEDKDKEKEKEKEQGKEKDHDKEKESKPRRRQRDKSSSTSNNLLTSAQSTTSHPRKKPKLEAGPPEKSPSASPLFPTVSAAPDSTFVSAPASAAPVPPPKLSPPISSASTSANHSQPSPPQFQQQQARPMNTQAQLLFSPQPTSLQEPHPVASSPYATMVSAPPSRPQSQPLAPPPQRTSGQNYDPIRSAFGTNSSSILPPKSSVPASFSPPPRPVSPRPFRASASPAISSIIDHPQNTSPPQYAPRSYGSPSRGASSYPPTHPPVPPSSSPYGHQSLYGPPPPHAQPPQEAHMPTGLISSQASPSPPAPEAKPSTASIQQTSSGPIPMEVDSEPPASETTDKTFKEESKLPSAEPASKPPSPKPPRLTKEAPSTLPQGSGLIPNVLFGIDDSASDTSSQQIPTIVVHIPLQGNANKIVNFARLAEEQYGFAALHPRLAAHKERMARVAAAGAALERNDRIGRGLSAGESADEDLSLDVDRDSELEGEGQISATVAQATDPADGKKRRRRRKVEEYDREDPFVDDTEMVWQEQAAASKDGFFVYSGPLVSEGEKVQVERYVLSLEYCTVEHC